MSKGPNPDELKDAMAAMVAAIEKLVAAAYQAGIDEAFRAIKQASKETK